jgi:hypothetical protein
MNPETLIALLENEPYVPLRLHLVDGRHVDILNPGLCFVVRMSLHLFRAREHARGAEDFEIISVRGIVSVEAMPPSQAA